MKWPAPHRSSPMKIKVVKKGSFTAKPMTTCPFEVDEPLNVKKVKK